MSLAGYTFFLLFIAVSNALLGFGGAMLLGHGPRLPAWKLQFAWRQWLAIAAAWWAKCRLRRATAEPVPLAPAPDDSFAPLTLTPIQFADAAPPIDNSAQSFDELLAEFSREVAAIHNDLSDLDQRVRTCTAAPTVDSVEECVADLKQTGQRLYQQQTLAIAAAHDVRAEGHAGGAASSDAQEIVEQHAQQLRQSLEAFDTWKVDPDHLDDDCCRLLAATEQLLQSCDEVGQALEDASTKQVETVEPVETNTSVVAPHAICHKSIHGVARVGSA